MKKINRGLHLLLAILMLTLCATGAEAALQAVGPTDPITTLPTWYMDSKGLPLAPCVDQNGFCILPPPFDALTIPTAPITTTGPINDANFPGEAFYYSAFAADPLGAAGKFTIENGETVIFGYVVEFAFLSGVVPQTGITFLRTDLQKMRNLTPNATYRLTHPYGTFEFQTDNAGVTIDAGPGIRFEDQPGTIANYLPPLFKAAPNTNMDTFLTPLSGTFVTDPLDPAKVYIGDPAIPVLVTGSQSSNNFVLIERLNASGIPVAAWQTNYFTLMGRKFTGQIPSPMTIDRVTYARDATSAQVDVFATAMPAANLTISGTGLAATLLAKDITNNGKFFVDLPSASLPTGVSITNSLDVPSIQYPVTLVDEVKVSQAVYNPTTRNLTIKADSRDKLAPLPTLTVPQFAAPNTLDATGTLVTAIAANTIPPMTVTVHSSKGGSDTIPISVVAQVPPPVAVNDSAATSKAVAVTINVLTNDTSVGGTIDPATVAIVAAPASGATAVPAANGTVLYTPTAAFAGTETFTYTVKDAFGQISNAATVSVLVNSPPVAGNDSATAAINSTVGINVIANDVASNSSINSTTVNIVSLATCGTTNVLTTGVVQFTAPATVPAAPGTCSFSYVVSDTFVPSAISNVATVTVTITPPIPPVAVNDSATTTSSSTVVINVIANDTSSSSAIDPASIVVTAPTGGTAAANLNGTVSYTAPATPGTYTFTYTVKDNAVPPSTSNSATVTITVVAPFVPPTAVNDSATLVAGTSVIINVAANDIAGTNPISPLTVSSVTVVSAPTNGTAVVNLNGAGTVTYTPAIGFSGTDSFTYNIKDTLGNVSATNATVGVTVTTPVATESITITRAQYTLSTGSWRIDGSTTARVAGQTMKFFNSPTVPADAVTGLLATVTVGGNGSFTWTSANGAPLPNSLRRISVLSSVNPNNNKSEQVTVTVR